jgi:hypothetical protein
LTMQTRLIATTVLGLSLAAVFPMEQAWGFFVTYDITASAGSIGPSNNDHDSAIVTATSASDTVSSTYDLGPIYDGSYMSAYAGVGVTSTVGHLAGTAVATGNNGGLAAIAQGHAELEWGDTFTATGTAQSDGFIHLPWSFTLSATLHVTDANHDNAFVRATLIKYFPNVTEYLADVQDSGDAGSVTHNLSGTILAHPGEVFYLFGHLTLDAYVNSPSGPETATVVANNSAIFHLDADPVTGASYTTESGLNYFTVPEPETGVLVTLGLGFIAIVTATPARRSN